MPRPPPEPTPPTQVAWVEEQLRAIAVRALESDQPGSDELALKALTQLGRALGMFSTRVALPRRVADLSEEDLRALLDRIDSGPNQGASE